MKDLLYLSLQYIRHHRVKLLVLTLAITLVGWLPIAIQSIVDQTAQQLLARADQTPLVIGAPGSPLELALGSLYFRSRTAATLPYEEIAAVERTGHGTAIPLYYRFRVQEHPIVGTTPDYFSFRGLRLAAGRPLAMLGEAVIGARVAEAMNLGVGDHVISSPESVFDLAGVYPLKMPVVGVLAPSLSPDDEAVFVDLKTAWVIQGLGHGHEDLNRREASGQILKREGDNLVANASVRQYNEITPDNLESFHFHGDVSDNPISAIIPLPRDDKSAALLLGMDRQSAARFSFLLSIPVIASAGALKAWELAQGTAPVDWGILAFGAVVSGVTAYLCIALFLRLLDRLGLMPFVYYRVMLAILLYWLWLA